MSVLVRVSHDLRPAPLPADAQLRWEHIEPVAGPLTAGQIAAGDALMLLRPAVTEETLRGASRLCLVARWGVGYDNIDVDACTRAGVVVTITPEAVRRPVASGALALILALAHRVPERDRAARAGGWDDRFGALGTGLAGRTLGVVGLGNIGRELLTLARPWGMRQLAADPYLAPEVADRVGATLVDLDRLLAASDLVCVTCALTPATRHLINAERLARMRPDAFLVNVARGGIVDQQALVQALRAGTIRGAALDTLEHEPPDPDDPILALDNVLLAPHAIGWTDQLVQANTAGCYQAIRDLLLAGRPPRHVVNPQVLASPVLRGKLERRRITLED